MEMLGSNNFVTVNELSKRMKKERSTIQKAIKKLRERKLLIRRQKNLTTGGFIYEYKLKDKELIKKEIVDLIKLWSQKAIKTIEEK